MENTSTLASSLQAIAALALVLGLIFLVAWAVRKYALGQEGGLNFSSTLGGKKPDKRLRIVETLILDARYRMVAVDDHGVRRTLLLGPQEAIQLGKSKEGDTAFNTAKALQPGESPTGLPHAASIPTLNAER